MWVRSGSGLSEKMVGLSPWTWRVCGTLAGWANRSLSMGTSFRGFGLDLTPPSAFR